MAYRPWGMLRTIAAALCAMGCAMAPAHARALPAGDPPLTRHTPDVEAYPQNFALAQDAQSVVYVANYDGVLIFDGERWELLRLPNRDIARSIAFDGADRIYVGGHDLFGYIQRDETGRERFHDLTTAFSKLLGSGETFDDIWDIHFAREGVFFRALRHLFLYQPATGATQVWRHAGRFGGIAQSGDRVVVQFRGEGLKELVDGQWRLLPGSEPLSELVWDFVQLPDGGLLTLAADGRWRVYRDGRVTDYPVPRSFPPSSTLSVGTELADGTVVLASGEGFLYALDPRTGAHREFRIDTGFLNDVIPDRGGGLLIAGEDGIIHMEWPAPWTLIGESYGLSSSLTAMKRWGERWYALSSSGVSELEMPAGEAPRFHTVGWTPAEAWDLLPLDGRNALLAESYALMLVTDGKARAITHGALYPRVLRRCATDPDVVFVGLEPGLAVVRRGAGGWRLVLEDHSLDEMEATGLIEAEPRVLWLSSDRGGIARLRLSADYSKIEEARRFGPDDGISYGELPGGSITMQADGTLIASTNAGLFRWNGTRFEITELDGLEAVRDRGEWVKLAVAPGGARWAYSYKHVYRENNDGWRREDVGGVRRGAIESVAFDEAGQPLFSSTRAVMRFGGAAVPTGNGAPTVLLRALERRNATGEVEALPLTGNSLSLPHGDYTLLVRFALPEYRRRGVARYATRLTGLELRLTDWSESHALQYAHLPPGKYTLEVMARDSLGRESHIAPLRLTIQPAWYAGTLARAVWLMLSLGTLGVLTLVAVRWRTARLERLVATRTRELRAANERLDAMAHLDGLTGVSNRRELDRHLEATWAQCEKERRPLSVLAIDVDGFKRYNDQYGHQSGDEMLVRLVREASSCLDGSKDLLARYGGDEFFVVRAGANLHDSLELAETLRRRIEAAGLGATISVGVAAHAPGDGATVRDLVRAADAALYAAKAAGRNRVAA